MSVNYGALRGDAGASAMPDDGLHTVRLQDTTVIPVDNGSRSRLKTSWIDLETGLLFEAWFELTDPYKMQQDRTLDLLDGLGVDRDQLGPQHPLDVALLDYIGHDYQVATTRWKGAKSEGVNLTIEDQLPQTVGQPTVAAAAAPRPPDYRPAPQQQPLTSDIPSDPLPWDKDDIPF